MIQVSQDLFSHWQELLLHDRWNWKILEESHFITIPVHTWLNFPQGWNLGMFITLFCRSNQLAVKVDNYFCHSPTQVGVREVINKKKKWKYVFCPKFFRHPPSPPKVWTKNRIKFFRDQIKQFYQNEIQKVWIGGLTPPPPLDKIHTFIFFF